MKVLVLGGTGAMGVPLVQILSEKGYEVFVTTRVKRESSGNVFYLQGNAQNEVFLRETLSTHWDIIVDFMVYSTEIFSSRISFLLEATNQYIFFSSSRVYADSLKPITEDSPRLLDVSDDKEFLLTNEYSLVKARQENILFASKNKNWTIIRPYITYNTNRLQLGVLEKEQWLYRAIHGKTIVFCEEMKTKITTMTTGVDVAKGIVSLVNNNNALGEVFHITTNESKTWDDILNIYLSVLENKLGFRPKVYYEHFDYYPMKKFALYQIKYDRFFDRRFDNAKIENFIEVKGSKELKEGLKEALESFLLNPVFFNIGWRLEALHDKLTKEKTPLNEIKGIKQKVKYIFFRYLF